MSGTNPVAQWAGTDFTSQNPATYKANIDADNSVSRRMADSFAPYALPTPVMRILLDPGFLFNGSSGALTEIGCNFTGVTASGSAIITGMSRQTGLAVGQSITGPGVPSGATVTSIDSATQIHMSANASASATVALETGQQTGLITAPATNSRIDRVVIDSGTGLLSVVTGTSGVTPSPPAIPSGALPVAQILLTSSSTSITSAMITDERAVWGGGSSSGGGIQWAIAAGTGDAITAAFTPAIPSLYDGLIVGIRALTFNTLTNPTFKADATALRTITRLGGQALNPQDITGALAEYLLRYNLTNTRWELLNPSSPEIPWGVCGGTGDAITCTLNPTVGVLYDGLLVTARASAANTLTNPTFKADGTALEVITKSGGQVLAQNDIVANLEMMLRYRAASSNWELMNPAVGSALPAGAITPYAGLTEPTGFYFCYGQPLSRTTDANLFNAITKQTTGNVASGNTLITSVASITNITLGMPISGPGIQTGTVITAVAAGQITLSLPPTGTQTGAALVIAPNGVGDGTTTFNAPDMRGTAAVGRDDMGGTAANRVTTAGSGINGVQLGARGGAETVTLTSAQMALHGHAWMGSASAQSSANASGGVGGLMVSQNASSFRSNPAFTGTPATTVSQQIGGNTGGGNAHQNMMPALITNYIIKR